MNNISYIKYSNNLLKFNNIFKYNEGYLFSSNKKYHNSIYKNIIKNNNIIISHNKYINNKIPHINFVLNYNNQIDYNNNNIINILITEKHKITTERYDLVFYSNQEFNTNFKNFLIKNNNISNINLLINIIYFNIYTSINKLYIFDYTSFLSQYNSYEEYIYNYNIINDFFKWCKNNNYINIILIDSDTLYRINFNHYKKQELREININDKKLNIIIKNKNFKKLLNNLIFKYKIKLLTDFLNNKNKNFKNNTNVKKIGITPKKKILKTNNKKNINTKIINQKKNKKINNNNYDPNDLSYINF
jgi:hypothetical protein